MLPGGAGVSSSQPTAYDAIETCTRILQARYSWRGVLCITLVPVCSDKRLATRLCSTLDGMNCRDRLPTKSDSDVDSNGRLEQPTFVFEPPVPKQAPKILDFDQWSILGWYNFELSIVHESKVEKST